MFSPKRVASIIISIVFVFTNTSVYSHPENLAADSLLQLWKKKKIDPKKGFIVTERLMAIHKGISQGGRTSESLRAIDIETVQRHTDTESLTKYPFDYHLIPFRDKRIWGMIDAKIYKDKYGDKQLVLFYDPNDPPWDILEKFGVEIKDREFAKRGFWITYKDNSFALGRRAFLLTLFALTRCVWDPSGLPVAPDGGHIPDGGVQPDNTIEQQIEVTTDNSNNPVTILPTSTYTSSDTIQHLSPLPEFVRNNNAAFRYNGRNWHWLLSESDRTNIIDNGFTYVFNGRNHKIKLIGKDNTGQTKTIIFNPQIPGVSNYDQPYRVIISATQIAQLAEQIGLKTSTINIHFENLEPSEDFILNGLQKQYAVVPTQGEVTPDRINPNYERTMSSGVSVDTTPTTQGVDIRVTMSAGDNGRYGGINIPTRSGGIDLNDPDLQAAWKMDGIDLGTDSGPNANGLTNINGVESTPGRFGNAAQFTNANQTYLTIPPEQQTGLHITGDMTVSAWINVTSYPFQGFIIAAKQSGPVGQNVDYSFYLENGNMLSWSGNGNVMGNSPVSTGEWHHVAFVRQGNNITFYLDGEFNGTSEQVFTSLAPDAPFYIGHNGLGAYGDGLLDELAIFDRALTQEEIQGLMNPIDSSNFLTLPLNTLKLRASGNSPFMLRLIDEEDEILDIFILGLDPTDYGGLINEFIRAQEIMNPSFDLSRVKSVQPLVMDSFIPVPDGETFTANISLRGLVGTPTFRHRYATDYHDPDMEKEDYDYLDRNLKRLKKDKWELLTTESGIPVIGIKEWEDETGQSLLLENGLGFIVNGRVHSAFTSRDRKIYIPHPELVRSKLMIEDVYIKGKIAMSIEKRNKIIFGHEIDEINHLDHKEAVFNEFSSGNSINGLNYADIVTILLETLIAGAITTIDEDFHRQFITNLLLQGMFLDREGNTYLRIVREIIDGRIDEDNLRKTYRDVLSQITDRVTSHRFTHRSLSPEETTISDHKLLEEPGFRELFATVEKLSMSGTIYIDLAKFLVKNNSLATEDEVVTIDFEYLKRFVAFIRKLEGTNVKIKGIYSQNRQRTEIIEQLTSIIRRDFGLSDEKFPIHNVDFSEYLEFIGGLKNAKNTVSMLSEASWQDIPDRTRLKIVDSSMDKYNRVYSSGWEFYAALRGLNYDTPSDFLQFIIREVLEQLVSQKIITQDEAKALEEEILKYGIAFIPTHLDPILYYRTIENQIQLLIAA